MRLAKPCALFLLAALALLASSSAAAQGATLHKIRQQGFIRVGFANEAPYAYTDADGRLVGESPAVFRHVMQQLGVPRVDGVLTEWGSLIPGLKAGRFDAIVASMYITPRRCRQVLFANPTYGVGEAFIVRAGNPDGISTYADAVAGRRRMAFVAGTDEMRHGRLAGLKRAQLMVVADMAGAVAAVKAGRASAAAFTALTAQDLAGKDAALERAEPFTFEHAGKRYRGEGSFAFRRQDRALRDAVNAELARFIGTDAHLALVAGFGFDRSTLPEKTAAQLCAGS